MAVEVVVWVFTHSRSKNAERLVMLAVADACRKPDGTGAWLSNAALRAKTNLSERAVQLAVARCEEHGELRVERGRGRGGVNRFAVTMTAGRGTPENPAESAPLQETPQNLRPAESAVNRTDEDTQANPQNPADSAPNPRRRKGAESAPGTVSTKKPSSKVSSTARNDTRRGTRIPADFRATTDMITWAREHTPGVGAAETAAFIDHFTAAPGVRGSKVDWQATWRNWMRRAQKDFDARTRRADNGAFRANGATYQPATTHRIPTEERCAKHPTFRATTCGPCRSERHGASGSRP